MESLKYIVRQMKDEDFEEVIRICTEVGFTIAKHDLKIGYNLDPKGFFVAQDINSGEIIGSCTGIKLSAHFAYISTYAVKSKYQNKGIGSSIWKHVIGHIGSESNISLTALSMFPKYCIRFGSVIIDDKISMKYLGEHKLLKYDLLVNKINNISIIPINDENLKSVSIYDTNVCGFNRESMLREALKQSETVMIAAIDDHNKQIIGYCKLALSDTNYVLAQPLYANNTEIAELLLSKGCREMSQFKSEGLLIYSWDSNDRMQSICDKIGLPAQRRGKILYTKMKIDCNFDKIFGRCSPFICIY